MWISAIATPLGEMASWGLQCSRLFLLSFNVLSMVVSGSIGAAGLFAFSKKHHGIGKEAYLNSLFVRVSVNLELTAMMAGGLLFLVSVLGFLGALRRQVMALGAYSAAMSLLAGLMFVVTAALAISPFIAKNFFHKYMSPDLVMHYRQSADWDNLLDQLQSSFECCGIGPRAYKDWEKNHHFRCLPDNPSLERCSVPASCCRNSADRKESSARTAYPGYSDTDCGKDALALTRKEAEEHIYDRNCLDSVLTSVRQNVVVFGGVSLLASIMTLIVAVTTRDFKNNLLRLGHSWQEEEEEEDARTSDSRTLMTGPGGLVSSAEQFHAQHLEHPLAQTDFPLDYQEEAQPREFSSYATLLTQT